MVVSEFGNASLEVDTKEAISGIARLAGSFLFRSFEIEINDAKPGDVMLSEQANTKGRELVNTTYVLLQKFGVQIDKRKMSGEDQIAIKSKFVDVIGRIQNPALKIMQKYELNYEEMAHSAAIATAYMIEQSTDVVPEVAFSLAMYHYIEGSKTYPSDFID